MNQIFISQTLALSGIIMIIDFFIMIFNYIRTKTWIKLEYNFVQTYSTVITMFGVILIWGGINPIIWITGIYFIN